MNSESNSIFGREEAEEIWIKSKTNKSVRVFCHFIISIPYDFYSDYGRARTRALQHVITEFTHHSHCVKIFSNKTCWIDATAAQFCPLKMRASAEQNGGKYIKRMI